MPSFNMSNYCTPERLGQELSSDENVLLIDCRPQTEFARSNIVGAINVALPSLMLRRLKKGNLNISCIIPNNEGKERFKKYYKSHLVILYDECSTEINSNPSSIISLLLKRLGQDGCDACFLLGGFSTFEERYPEYCSGNGDQEDGTIVGLKNLQISDDSSYGTSESDSGTPPHLACSFPVEVISYLYLGNAKNSADKEQLRKYGIKYILNVTPNVPNMYENDETFKYMQIPINDHWSQNLGVFFPDAIAFIDEARKNHCGVLVHCLAGISRSVTVTVAYLMQKFALKLNDAYDMVKKCKPNISPNFNFMGQLLDFERILDQNQNNIGKCSCESSLMCHCRDSNLIDNVSKDNSQNYQLDIRPA